MKRHRGDTAISVPKLLVRTPLAYLREAGLLKEFDDLARRKDRDCTHRSADSDLLQPDELAL